MANLKRLKKELVKLKDEELKDVLSFMTDEEEVVEEVVEVVEEKEEVKEEPKVEKKEEVQSQNITLSKDELAELIDGVLQKYATKEEVEQVKKKAKPFGEKQKVEKVETKESPTAQDLLSRLNSKFTG
jgi:hypothetical protein